MAILNTEIRYEGRAEVRYEAGTAPLVGDALVTLSADGHPDIEIHPDTGHSESIDTASGLITNGQIRSPNPSHYQEVSVSTADGLFHCAGKLFVRQIQTQLFGAAGVQCIRLGALRSAFEIKNAKAPKYWLLPLSNFAFPMGRHRYLELDDHPLWLDSGDADPETATNARPVIAFLFHGRPAFIQRVSEYDQLTQMLQGGTRRDAVTAVMVGEVGSDSFDFPQSAPDTWFPMHLLALLSFAAGNRIGAPWFELRDEAGRLCRRIHMHFGRPPYAPGSGVLDGEFTPTAIGHLITRAIESSAFGKTWLHIALQRVVESAKSGASLETRKVALARAIECLGKHFGCGTVDLSASLEASQRAILDEALRLAAQKVESIRTSAVEASQRRDLERIAQRIRGAAQKENSFGHSVVALAEMFNLPDADIVDNFFIAQPSGTTWAGALSRLRGAVMHEGYLDIANGTYSVGETGALIDHLHDLLTRIVLTIIGYEGPYRSLIAGSTLPLAVDWVRPDFDPAKLGFVIDGRI